MRIAIALTPPCDQYFAWSAQIGVTDFVARYNMIQTPEKFKALQDWAGSFGLRLSVVEGYLPIEDAVYGRPEREAGIDEICRLIETMGELGVPTLCYNFMPFFDMIRTNFFAPDRGGATSNSFDADLLTDVVPENERIYKDELWENLEYFLKRVLPVAESAGVHLAMHPDDPPTRTIRGCDQIMNSVEDFEKLVELVPSPANGICFCQGTFAEMGVDIPATIRRLGPHIKYVHFRDVIGSLPRFQETFHDNGKTDMYAAMKAYHDAGFHGAARPDHVPIMQGEEGDGRGYTMLGRLFAVGYMRGLIHAVEGELIR